MKKLLTIVIFACLSMMVYGQADDSTFFKGQIITFKDTIDCYINYKTIDHNNIEIKKKYYNNQILKYEREKIKSLKFRSFHFERVPINDKSYLFEKEADGYIELYSYLMEGTLPGGIYANVYVGSYIPFKEYYIKNHTGIYKLLQRNYNYILKDIFCNDSMVLEKLNKLSYNDLQKGLKDLVELYNSNPKNHPDSIDDDCHKMKNTPKSKPGVFLPAGINYCINYINGGEDKIESSQGGFGTDIGLIFYYQTNNNLRFLLATSYYSTSLAIKYLIDNPYYSESTVSIDEKVIFQHLAIMPGIEIYSDRYFWGMGIRIGIINVTNYNFTAPDYISTSDIGMAKQSFTSTGMNLFAGIPLKIIQPYISIEKPFGLPVKLGEESVNGEKYDVGIGTFMIQLGLRVKLY